MVDLIYPGVKQALCRCSGWYCILKIMQLRSAEAPRWVTSTYHMPVTAFLNTFFFSWKWKFGIDQNRCHKRYQDLAKFWGNDMPKLSYFTLLWIKQSSLGSSVWNDMLNNWVYYGAFKGWNLLKRASVVGVGQSVWMSPQREIWHFWFWALIVNPGLCISLY